MIAGYTYGELIQLRRKQREKILAECKTDEERQAADDKLMSLWASKVKPPVNERDDQLRYGTEEIYQ